MNISVDQLLAKIGLLTVQNELLTAELAKAQAALKAATENTAADKPKES